MLNDLWMFDLDTQRWSWKGGHSSLDTPGIYQQLTYVPDPLSPGARMGGTAWTDPDTGQGKLIGGMGYWQLVGVDSLASYRGGVINDMWSLDGMTLQR
jgi:hypothetical protein